jgi:PRTRC genetic system protein C
VQIERTQREFRYSGLVLPDPAPSLDIDAVRAVYASSYPEITTAAVSGPEVVDGKLVWTFTRVVGTKGVVMQRLPWRGRREAYLRERGRLADLIREGYIQNGLAVIEGGGHRVRSRHSNLIVIAVQENHHAANRPAQTSAGEPAA